jgi:hypothetical protein
MLPNTAPTNVELTPGIAQLHTAEGAVATSRVQVARVQGAARAGLRAIGGHYSQLQTSVESTAHFPRAAAALDQVSRQIGDSLGELREHATLDQATRERLQTLPRDLDDALTVYGLERETAVATSLGQESLARSAAAVAESGAQSVSAAAEAMAQRVRARWTNVNPSADPRAYAYTARKIRERDAQTVEEHLRQCWADIQRHSAYTAQLVSATAQLSPPLGDIADRLRQVEQLAAGTPELPRQAREQTTRFSQAVTRLLFAQEPDPSTLISAAQGVNTLLEALRGNIAQVWGVQTDLSELITAAGEQLAAAGRLTTALPAQ